jgi:hypothetical protein
LTGLLRKSLQPAASAATLSELSTEAVRATMMTEARKGVCAAMFGDIGVAISGGGASSSRLLCEPACDAGGVDGTTPMFSARSSLRISFVASMPSMTGS